MSKSFGMCILSGANLVHIKVDSKRIEIAQQLMDRGGVVWFSDIVGQAGVMVKGGWMYH